MSERAIAEKKKIVEALKDKVARAKVMLFSDCEGLTVKELTALRKKLRAQDTEFRIVKNTLLERTVLASGFPQLKGQFKGQTGTLLGYKDAVLPLKTLVGFLKDAEKGGIRMGVVDGAVFNEADLKKIAGLPSREVLAGKVVGGLKSPLYGLVNVLQGPIRKLVYALNEITQKRKASENAK